MSQRADLVIRNGRLITLDDGPPAARRGAAMRLLGVIERGDVAFMGHRITFVGRCYDGRGDVEIDAGGRVVMPGFVDCHTHACWAGDRFEEFERKQQGATYLEILKAGGGIMSTVRATRAASIEHLQTNTIAHLAQMLAMGTTVAEVKSGYGLDTPTEMRMLRVIASPGRRSTKPDRDDRMNPVSSAVTSMHIVPTFLGAHAIDGERCAFVERTINETLPAVVGEFGPLCCDAYCEEGAWSLDETRRLFHAAQSLGCPLRIHTDQFHSLGATPMAIEAGAVSVDHLEATTADDVRRIGQSQATAVCLPISGFQTDGRYARGRSLIDAGAAVAIATNFNPGSAPSPSMPFAMALAVRHVGLAPAEALCAATVNGAAVLGQSDSSGRLSAGCDGDAVVWDVADERALVYELAGVGADVVIAHGQIVRDSQYAWVDDD